MKAFAENGVHLWEDSLPTLRELRARGLRTAIVSNCDHSTRPIVDELGLEREADAVVLSFEVGVAKPDPGIYRAALDALDARPERGRLRRRPGLVLRGCGGDRHPLVHDRARRRRPGRRLQRPGDRVVLRDLRSLLDLV